MKAGLCLSLLLTLTASLPTSFLSTIQDPDNYSTAVGQVAAGLQALQEDFNVLQAQAQGSDSYASEVFRTSMRDSEVMSRDELTYLRNEIDALGSRVNYLEAIQASDSRECFSYVSCGRCTGHSYCVWCPTIQVCTAGDSQGPIGGECLNFQYATCDIDCGLYQGCFSCVSHSDCRWCQTTQTCTSPGNPACGENTECTNEGMHTSGSFEPDINTDLDEVGSELSNINQSISRLQTIITSLQSPSQSLPSPTFTPPPIPDRSLYNLPDLVDSLSQQETQADQNALEDTVNDVTRAVSGAGESGVIQGNGQIDRLESDFGESVRRTRRNIEQEYAAQRAAEAAAKAATAALEANQTDTELNTTEAFQNQTNSVENEDQNAQFPDNTTESVSETDQNVPETAGNSTESVDETDENSQLLDLNPTETASNSTSLDSEVSDGGEVSMASGTDGESETPAQGGGNATAEEDAAPAVTSFYQLSSSFLPWLPA